MKNGLVATSAVPRQADIVLLRRTVEGPLPFHGVWRHLTAWNALEFKGPTVDPRLRDLDLLVELGLGIDRRLNEEREHQQQPPLDRAEVSFWYLANHLGQRFLAEAEQLLGPPTALGEGLWRCQAVGRPVFLVSRDVLPVERDSVPLHLVSQEPMERELALAREVVAQPGFFHLYGGWLGYLHPAVLEEVRRMAQASGIQPDPLEMPTLDLGRLIEFVGLEQVIDQVGVKRVVEEVGLKRVVDDVGVKRVVDELGVNAIASQLTPQQRQEMIRLLQG